MAEYTKNNNYAATGQKNGYSQNGNAHDLSAFVFGKTAPAAPDLETAVLGALMIDSDAIATVCLILKKESFYTDAHQAIYEAIIALYNENKPIDMLTVTEKIKSMDKTHLIGGVYYLVELCNRVASAANIEYHARIIQQKHIQREVIKHCTSFIRDAYEDTTDCFDLCEKFQQAAIDITGSITNQATGMSAHFKEVYHKLTTKSEDGLSGVTSGLMDLDAITNGFQKTDLVVIAARPSMGKTNVMLKFAKSAAKSGYPVLIFSIEMSASQLLMRLASAETCIDFNRIKENNLGQREIESVAEAYRIFENLPFEIDDSREINIFQMRAKARAWKMKCIEKYGQVGLILVDYLQIVKPSDTKTFNREREVAAISGGLKTMAKEINIPVIALSQLGRQVESRGGSKKPQLSDLRESGAIEQDADLVGMLYRPEYYGIKEDAEGNNTEGVMYILIEKHRNGKLGEIKTRTNFNYHDLVDFDDNPYITNLISRPHADDFIDDNGEPLF